MREQLTKFFDKFASDFSAFDGELIAKRYATPFVPVSAEGAIRVLNTKAEVGGYFQSVLDFYQSKTVTKCQYRNLEFSRIGSVCVAAIVTWELLDDADKLVMSWRESYNLLERNGEFYVYSSANFAAN